MAKKSFIQGAAVLAVAGLLVKFLGAVFRIPLGNMIGDVGMASYQPAYYIYNLFLVLATSGIPVAISRMVSERSSFGQFHEADRVFRISRALMMTIGLCSFLIVFFGAQQFAELSGVPDSAMAVRAISPALVLVPFMASYRGYFQGQQDMTPTAISQLVEQIFRVAIGLTLAYMFYNGAVKGTSPESAGAAGATIGAVAGSVGGLIVMLIVYYRNKGKIRKRISQESREIRAKRESSRALLKQIVIIAIPITIGAAIMPIVNIIDTAVVTNRLVASGWEQKVAEGMYGQLASFCGSLVNFPQVLTQAVAMSLVPLIAAAWKQKDMPYLRENVQSGLRMSVILGMPCAVGLFVLAEPILLLLYGSENARAAAISAAPCLMVMSIGVVFLAVVQTLTGVLQGVGKQMIPVRNLIIGVSAKIVITWILTGIPAINIMGAAAGTVTAYIISAVLNIMAVKKYTGTHFDFMKTVVKPFIASVVMGIITWGSFHLLNNLMDGSRLATVIAILIAVVIYVFMIFAIKAITRDELVKMPKGDKLVRLLDRFIK